MSTCPTSNPAPLSDLAKTFPALAALGVLRDDEDNPTTPVLPPARSTPLPDPLPGSTAVMPDGVIKSAPVPTAALVPENGDSLAVTLSSESPESPPTPSIHKLRDVIQAVFPEYWPAVEAGLACTATLLLKDNANPTALILVGGPSTGKTTVASMFDGWRLAYRSDDFTPAAFVSHHANKTAEQLADIDLLPRIRHRVFLTPELAPIFRGKRDELEARLAIITRVLDGQGLTTDKGTYGQRGYTGDYLFSWLGCTTPFSNTAWSVMAQLGSRLFFFQLGAREAPGVDDLVQDTAAYVTQLERCQGAVRTFLDTLVQKHGGLPLSEKLNAIRSVRWNNDSRPVREWIARFALLLAAIRGARATEEAQPVSEAPHRAYAVLSNLARGRALLYGRRELAEDDLPLVARIALDSMPHGKVIRALIANKELRVRDVQAATGVRHYHTAERIMRDLAATGVVVFEETPEKRVHVPDGWTWLTWDTCRGLLQGCNGVKSA